ncbi:MAG: hypothetical protein Q9187_000346 [Circinaria calcarea]
MATHTPDPAAILPTTTAPEASTDPIRPTGTDALMADSRPEVAAATENTEITPGAGLGDVAAKDEDGAVLGYKAPGLVKSLRFAKKFFWFSDEAVEPHMLSDYLKSEKPEVGKHNVAHAGQTGKGLLFFAKRIEDKSHPAGILNLGDASDFGKDPGSNEFYFKLHGQKHTFQAATLTQRDSWLVVVESKAAEAKSSRDGIIGSEGYKKHMTSLGVPAVIASNAPIAAKSAATPKKSTEDKLHDNPGESDALATGSLPDPAINKHIEKSRSQSRKRQSIFGKVLGKKEEHDEKKEVKKEEKAEQKEMKKEEKVGEGEEKAELNEEKKEAKHGHHAGIVEPASFDAAAVAARVISEPVVPNEEAKDSSTSNAVQPVIPAEPAAMDTSVGQPSTMRETAPRPAKRSSMFGSFFNKRDNASPTRERKEKDIAPAVPSKDVEPTPVSATAPQLEDPTSTSLSQPAEPAAPASTTIPSVTTPSSESKGGIFGFMRQKEAQHQDKKEIKAEERGEEKVEKNGEVPAMAIGTPGIPGSEAPVPSTTTDVTATPTPEATKEKRRQSFFNTISGKKERRTDATSDAEGTDGEGRKTSGNKLGGLFRKASRSTKGPSAPMTESSPLSGPISEDTAATMEARPTTKATAEPSSEGIVPTSMNGKASEPGMSEGIPQQTPVPTSA